MSVMIKGMSLPKHADVNGEKDTAYKCLILAHSDNSVELVIDTAFASPYDNGHNIQRYPLTEIPTPHGRLIDADRLLESIKTNFYEHFGNYDSGQELLFDLICNSIEDFLTIIEAEVSEE